MTFDELTRFIYAERKIQQLTLDDMSFYAGIAKSAISEIEQGRSPNVSVSVLRKLLIGLGYELSYEVKRMKGIPEL